MLQRLNSMGIHGGIPQGSALGSLLFLVYVKDMPSLVHHGNLLQFADDTTLICSGDTCEEVEKNLSHDLVLISKWISQSKMWLNVNKSSAIWFSSKHSKRKSEYPPIMIDDQPLIAVTQQCYLIRNNLIVVFSGMLRCLKCVASTLTIYISLDAVTNI